MAVNNYKISGMTCGSCAMRIEKFVGELDGVESAHVKFKMRQLQVTANEEMDMKFFNRHLAKLGKYKLTECVEYKEKKDFSVATWSLAGVVVITIAFYLIQSLGMQSWSAPLGFMLDQWYLVTPLILLFGAQAGLFRAIHLIATHGGGGAMAASGGVSSGTMLACCMHNLVPLFPILGVSGLAVFFAAYQTEVFLVSILISLFGVGYMSWKFLRTKKECKTNN